MKHYVKELYAELFTGYDLEEMVYDGYIPNFGYEYGEVYYELSANSVNNMKVMFDCLRDGILPENDPTAEDVELLDTANKLKEFLSNLSGEIILRRDGEARWMEGCIDDTDDLEKTVYIESPTETKVCDCCGSEYKVVCMTPKIDEFIKLFCE